MSLFSRYSPISEAKEWRRVLYHAIGGLTELGFSHDESLLLVVSHAGRGLFDLSLGKRVERDDEMTEQDSPWINMNQRLVRGIGSAENDWFAVVGLWGGTLQKSGKANWVSEVVAKGRDELAVVHQASSPVWWVVDKPITEIKAFGFSNTGQYLVLGTSSDVAVFSNEA